MSRLTPAETLKPLGDLDASLLFPGISPADVKSQIDAWIKEAYTAIIAAGVAEANGSPPAKKFVYYKAYMDVYVRFLATPIRSDVVNEAMEQYDIKQIVEFKKLAIDALADFNAIIGELLNTVVVTSSSPSTALQTEITW